MEVCKKIINNVDFLKELVRGVVYKYHIYLNKKLNGYFDTSQKRINHLKGITKILIAIFLNNEKLKQKTIKETINAHKKVNRDLLKQVLEESFDILIDYYKSFLKEKDLIECIDDKNINEYKKSLLKAHKNLFENEIFEIESEKRDENIEKMHYKDEEKISAKEFLKEFFHDEYIIYEIEELFEEYYNISFIQQLNKQYINSLKQIISDFIRVFNYSFEFKDLAYGLETFLILLESTDIEHIENKELVKLLIDSIIDDLNKFFQSVFINQDAIDIHYLDASLLANIAQIEIILNQLKGE